ncbi:MAG: hypothetical protein IT222_12290 [Crocinitomix sp.]|nr:hypothetical protein [Crocinitomix sp.]
MNTPTTIDEVIAQLDEIIETSIATNSPMGYFAALYRKVTVKVKEGIATDYFENGPRMEQLDVIFANRYLHAYQAYQTQNSLTESWKKTFEISADYWPIVLQHLLLGMNAHINLDLGIAAAEVCKNENIQDLKGDFDKINVVLSDLVGEVQDDLCEIWPTLKRILKWSKNLDDFMVDFSMKLARNGAWKFAVEVHATSPSELPAFIAARDQKVAKNVKLIFSKNIFVRFVYCTIRWREKGTVAQKIEILRN